MNVWEAKKYIALFLGLFLLIPLAAYGAGIGLGEDCGSPGDTVTIPITLSYSEGETPNICSIGIDIGFDPDVLENPQVEIGPAGSAADKGVISSLVTGGLFRIGILAIANRNTIGEGVLANVTFTIKAQPAEDCTILTNTPSASDPDGNPISVTGEDGEVCPYFVNHPPVAQDQSVSTNQNTPVDLTLVASDSDGDPLTYSTVSLPSHGTLSGAPPNVTYMPDTDYTGSDSFTFKAYDGTDDSNTAIVNITVTHTNNPPVAQDQSVSTNQNTPVDLTLVASDSDGDPLTYSTVSLPSHGTLSGTAPNLTYIPDTDYTGTDSFIFKANDGTADSNVATVSINVSYNAGVNNPPVAQDQSVTTKQDMPVDITLVAMDADSDALTYTIVDDPGHGNLSGTAPNVTYTPDMDYTGSDSFTFEANDGTVDSNVATVNITVSAKVTYPSITTVLGKVIDPESVRNKIDRVLKDVIPGVEVDTVSDNATGILDIDVGRVSYPMACSEMTSGENPNNSRFELVKGGLFAMCVLPDEKTIRLAPMVADPEGLSRLLTG